MGALWVFKLALSVVWLGMAQQPTCPVILQAPEFEKLARLGTLTATGHAEDQNAASSAVKSFVK
jgi:hypothetical protein